MIRDFILYYKFNILFLPFFVFWFSYITYVVIIFYYKYSNNYLCLYFPEKTNRLLVDLFFVSAERFAFIAIHKYENSNIFTKLKNSVLPILFIIIFGVPLSIFLIIINILKYSKNINNWEIFFKYKKAKIIIEKGNILRNMKKLYDLKESHDTVVHNVIIIKGYFISKKGDHIGAYVKNTNLGVLATSKIQELEIAPIKYSNTSLFYPQGFHNPIINVKGPSNYFLKFHMNHFLDSDCIVANYRILKEKPKTLIYNINKKQELVEIKHNYENLNYFIKSIDKLEDMITYNKERQELVYRIYIIIEMIKTKQITKFDAMCKYKDDINLLKKWVQVDKALTIVEDDLFSILDNEISVP